MDAVAIKPSPKPYVVPIGAVILQLCLPLVLVSSTNIAGEDKLLLLRIFIFSPYRFSVCVGWGG